MHAAEQHTTRKDDAIIGASLIAGTANVIMQLAHPGVGYGVVESTVESGQVFRHPIKRTRTTLTYLAVAALGTDTDKRQYRAAVNRVHAKVRSGDSSPMEYNAFDTELQLWVAACLYKGVEDTREVFIGPLSTADFDTIYADSAAFGTTLQVPYESWPVDRAQFQKYWDSVVEQRIHIDDTVLKYLHDLVKLRFLPTPLGAPFAPLNQFLTTGFLPPRFRAEMRLPWSANRQKWFDRSMKVLAKIVRWSPKPLRQFPFNVLLADVRRRIATQRPLV